MNITTKKLLCSAAAVMLPALGWVGDSVPASSPGRGLTGVVFHDKNEDGLMQEEESPAFGVIVDLLDSEANFVSRNLTDEDGIYRFENLPAGVYFLRFEFSQGFGVRSRGIEIAGVPDAKGVVSDAKGVVPDAKGVVPDAKGVVGPEGPADYVFVPVPVISPDSRYLFTRLQLINPANFMGQEVSPYTP